MLYYIYKVKENQSESEVHIMRIYVVTEMIDLKVKRMDLSNVENAKKNFIDKIEFRVC